MKKYEGHALVTGGSDGIGLEFANELAAQGYDLVLVARNPEKLEAVAAEIKNKYPIEIVTIAQDLSRLESTDLIWNLLQEKQVHVGLLVNNAGFNTFERFLNIDRQYHIDMVNTLCISVMDLTYKFLPPMIEKGSGGIIFVSSFASQPALLPLDVVYSGAKSFVLKLGTGLHAEYGSKGIDILTVCPGAVDTNIHAAAGHPHPAGQQLTTQNVVSASLDALGNKIVLLLNKNRLQKLLNLLSPFMSYKLLEKIMKKFVKKAWGVDL
jgi:short-subunit dehydrogenase